MKQLILLYITKFVVGNAIYMLMELAFKTTQSIYVNANKNFYGTLKTIAA